MPRYKGSPDFRHDGAERIGVLLVNSGSPDSASPRDVRHFLARLLSDPRVVELPRALWLPILHGIILRTRPMRSARKYRQVFKDGRSPLIELSEAMRESASAEMAQRVLAPVSIEIGMLYSNPSIEAALHRLIDAGARRLLVLPLFPQYCGVTTGAVHDQVSEVLSRLRWLPEVRHVAEYHDHPAYIEAVRTSIEEHWRLHGRTEHLLFSFHGIPEAYFKRGDPYFCKVQKSSRLVADELNLREDEWSVAFQSKFGPGLWLKPYAHEVLEAMPARGVRSVTVACPGFAVDCLETLEEICIENRARFLRAGGTRFDYVPALNARPSHARMLAELITQHSGGWTTDLHAHESRAAAPASAPASAAR